MRKIPVQHRVIKAKEEDRLEKEGVVMSTSNVAERSRQMRREKFPQDLTRGTSKWPVHGPPQGRRGGKTHDRAGEG